MAGGWDASRDAQRSSLFVTVPQLTALLCSLWAPRASTGLAGWRE